MRRALLSAVLVAACAGAARAADDPRRAEAAERFDRGMALLEQGDNAGALAELTRVYELAPHPQVLYNLGLVYAAMKRPVEAARALDEVLAAPGALPAASLARARRTRDEQARGVARLELTTNVPATIDADGVEVGKTPLAAPLALAAGTHVIGATGAGYLPARKQITLAGQTTQQLHLELASSELRLAQLAVRAAVPGAEVVVDGQPVGRTPLPGTIAVAPGKRSVELRRPGYVPAQRDIALDDGARGELSFDLLEDAGAAVPHGRLALAVSEPDPDVVVDGRPLGAYRDPMSLPPGPHDLRIARAGFLTAERTVDVPEGGDVLARVTLVPTPETRAAYKRRAQVRRAWGLGALIGGGAVAVAGGAILGANRASLADARDEYARVQQACAMAITQVEMDLCTMRGPEAADKVDRREAIQTGVLIGLGVGIAAAGVGVALLATGDDPARYDRAAHDPDAPILSGWAAPTGGGLTVAGGF